jgi:pimeloyl-ACP methyl ester carboxylesterase
VAKFNREPGEDIVAQKVDVNGVGIEYEIVGNGKRPAVITPGGRYVKETAGLKGLAEELAKGGFRVLIWDRPNSGGSDIYVNGPTEAAQTADVLAALLRKLEMAPALVVGGSGGSRQMLTMTTRHPDVVERLFLFWMTGGVMGVVQIAFFYCHDSWLAAATGGMEAVAELPLWKGTIAKNPRNRELLLKMDPQVFMQKMIDWAEAFMPTPGSPVGGINPADLAKLKMPVMILNSGKSDFNHPRATTEAVHKLIPHSQLADPPWGDREWIDRMSEMLRLNDGGQGLFARWPLLAPQILAFANS